MATGKEEVQPNIYWVMTSVKGVSKSDLVCLGDGMVWFVIQDKWPEVNPKWTA